MLFNKKYIFIFLVFFTCHAKREFNGNDGNGGNGNGNAEFGLGTAGTPMEDKWNIETETDYFKAGQDCAVSQETSILYGVNDWFGISITFLFFWKLKQGGDSTKGIGDTSVELIFNVYKDPIHIFTLSVGVQAPTGDFRKVPATSTGSFDFVGEFYFAHDSQYWYFDSAVDWILTGKHNNKIKTGNSFSYFLTGGFKTKLKKGSPTTLYFLTAMTGFYGDPNDSGVILDPDSGGNVIFIGPYFSFLRKNILVEATFQVPFSQTLRGNQPKFDFYSLISIEVQF
jgi:hypothetical protein